MCQEATTYNLSQIVSATFMIAMMLWLTISAPFIYAGQQSQNQTAHAEPISDNNDEEAPTPITNTSEEKKPASANAFAEEFLCLNYEDDYAALFEKCYRDYKNPTSYIAFHGELICPPPDDSIMYI